MRSIAILSCTFRVLCSSASLACSCCNRQIVSASGAGLALSRASSLLCIAISSAMYSRAHSNATPCSAVQPLAMSAVVFLVCVLMYPPRLIDFVIVRHDWFGVDSVCVAGLARQGLAFSGGGVVELQVASLFAGGVGVGSSMGMKKARTRRAWV